MILATSDADRRWTGPLPRLKHARLARLGPEENSSKLRLLSWCARSNSLVVSPPSCSMIPSARSSVSRPAGARVLTREKAMHVKRHGSPFLVALVRLPSTSRSSPSETKSCRGAQKSETTALDAACGSAGFRPARGGELSCGFVCNVVFATCWRTTSKCGSAFGRKETRLARRLRPVGRAAARAQKRQAIGPTIAPLFAQRRAAHLLCRDVRCRTWISM